MTRFIKELQFHKTNKITIIDNVESWEIDGTIDEFCPKILERWKGYLDRVKKEWEDIHQLREVRGNEKI